MGVLPQDTPTHDHNQHQDPLHNSNSHDKKHAFKSMLRQRQIAVRHSKGSSSTTSDTLSRHSQSTFISSIHDIPTSNHHSMYPHESQGISLKTLREEAEASGISTNGHYHHGHNINNNNHSNNSTYGSARHHTAMKEEPITIHGPAESLFTRQRDSSNNSGNSPRDESFGSPTEAIFTSNKEVSQEAFDLREILMARRVSGPPPRTKQELIMTFNHPEEPPSAPLQLTTRPGVSTQDNVSMASMVLPQTIRFLPVNPVSPVSPVSLVSHVNPVNNDSSNDSRSSASPPQAIAPMSLAPQAKPVLPASTKFPLPPKPDVAHAKSSHPVPSQAGEPSATGKTAQNQTLIALEERLKQKLLSQKRDEDKTSKPTSPITLTTSNHDASKTPPQPPTQQPQQTAAQQQRQKQRQQQQLQEQLQAPQITMPQQLQLLQEQEEILTKKQKQLHRKLLQDQELQVLQQRAQALAQIQAQAPARAQAARAPMDPRLSKDDMRPTRTLDSEQKTKSPIVEASTNVHPPTYQVTLDRRDRTERGYDRGSDRGSDRGNDRGSGSDRGSDRSYEGGYDRGYDRSYDRDRDRYDRDRGEHARGYDRSKDRGYDRNQRDYNRDRDVRDRIPDRLERLERVPERERALERPVDRSITKSGDTTPKSIPTPPPREISTNVTTNANASSTDSAVNAGASANTTKVNAGKPRSTDTRPETVLRPVKLEASSPPRIGTRDEPILFTANRQVIVEQPKAGGVTKEPTTTDAPILFSPVNRAQQELQQQPQPTVEDNANGSIMFSQASRRLQQQIEESPILFSASSRMINQAPGAGLTGSGGSFVQPPLLAPERWRRIAIHDANRNNTRRLQQMQAPQSLALTNDHPGAPFFNSNGLNMVARPTGGEIGRSDMSLAYEVIDRCNADLQLLQQRYSNVLGQLHTVSAKALESDARLNQLAAQVELELKLSRMHHEMKRGFEFQQLPEIQRMMRATQELVSRLSQLSNSAAAGSATAVVVAPTIKTIPGTQGRGEGGGDVGKKAGSIPISNGDRWPRFGEGWDQRSTSASAAAARAMAAFGESTTTTASSGDVNSKKRKSAFDTNADGSPVSGAQDNRKRVADNSNVNAASSHLSYVVSGTGKGAGTGSGPVHASAASSSSAVAPGSGSGSETGTGAGPGSSSLSASSSGAIGDVAGTAEEEVVLIRPCLSYNIAPKGCRFTANNSPCPYMHTCLYCGSVEHTVLQCDYTSVEPSNDGTFAPGR
ncbi:hypothetical protein CPC16_005936 [Podila verticillata]|nr:hypothetical protein CPC16_005936 [Podila verticillata]